MLRVFLKNNVVGDKLHMCVQFSKHLGNGFVVYILKSEDCAGGKKKCCGRENKEILAEGKRVESMQ